MSSLRRIAAITHTTADLAAQLRELHRLREMVRKETLAAATPPPSAPSASGPGHLPQQLPRRYASARRQG